MNVKEKAKNFWEKHQETIINVGAFSLMIVGSVLIVNGTVQYVIPYKGKEARDNIIRLLRAGDNGMHSVYTAVNREGIPISELGELGLNMVSEGVPKNIKARKFIVIGDPFK